MRIWSKGRSAEFLVLGLLVLFPVSLGAQSTLIFDNFIYVNNNVLFGPNVVSGYGVDRNGNLTPLPNSPFATNGTAMGGGSGVRIDIAVGRDFRKFISATGNFLFVSNEGSNDISAFSIDPLTGNLSLVNGRPFPTGIPAGFERSLAVTPDNLFLYSGNFH